jgi:hypothetical protein
MWLYTGAMLMAGYLALPEAGLKVNIIREDLTNPSYM